MILTREGTLEGYVAGEVLEHPGMGEAMLDGAEPIDGPYIKHFRRLAKELSTCMCLEFAEGVGGEAYSAAVFIDQAGDIRGRYHRTKFAEGTGPDRYFNGIGKTIRAFDTLIGPAGFLICDDRWNPMMARALVLLLICNAGLISVQTS